MTQGLRWIHHDFCRGFCLRQHKNILYQRESTGATRDPSIPPATSRPSLLEPLRCFQRCFSRRSGEAGDGTTTGGFGSQQMGVSLNGGTPKHTPKWSFLVGKPMVVGYHHCREHPDRGLLTMGDRKFCWDISPFQIWPFFSWLTKWDDSERYWVFHIETSWTTHKEKGRSERWKSTEHLELFEMNCKKSGMYIFWKVDFFGRKKHIEQNSSGLSRQWVAHRGSSCCCGWWLCFCLSLHLGRLPRTARSNTQSSGLLAGW